MMIGSKDGSVSTPAKFRSHTVLSLFAFGSSTFPLLFLSLSLSLFPPAPSPALTIPLTHTTTLPPSLPPSLPLPPSLRGVCMCNIHPSGARTL